MAVKMNFDAFNVTNLDFMKRIDPIGQNLLAEKTRSCSYSLL